MSSPFSLGISKEIVTRFMKLLGENSQLASDYFSNDATIDWDSNKVTGKFKIFDFLKEIPLFTHTIIEFDCQTVADIPCFTIVTSDGYLDMSGSPNRYHATFMVKLADDERTAHITYFALSFV